MVVSSRQLGCRTGAAAFSSMDAPRAKRAASRKCIFLDSLLAAGLALMMAVPALAEDAAGADKYAQLILADEPVGYWRFTGDQPENLGTASGQLTGVVKGAVQFGQEGPQAPVFPLFNPQNQGVNFPSGDASYIVIEDPGEKSVLDFENGDSITMEAWVRPAPYEHNGHYYILGKGRTHRDGKSYDNHNYSLRLSRVGGAAGLSFVFRSAGEKSDWHRWTSGGLVPIGDGWHHVALVYTFGQPDSLRAYVDGSPVTGKWDMGGKTEQAPVVDDDQLWIGSSMGGNHTNSFRGGLDEVALYRQALTAEQIAARYRYVTPKVEVDLSDLPEDAVRVDIFEGIPNKKSWDFRPPKFTGRFEAPGFVFLDVPNKYNEQGITIDRTNPFLIRAYGYITLPEGKQQILVRCRNASRLYLDDELIAETKFHSISGSAHGLVVDYEPTLAPNLRMLHRGDTEAVAQVEGDGQRHLLRFEMIVGGQNHRPDFGETAVFIAPPGEDFRLVSSKLEVKLTEAEWVPFAEDYRLWMIELDAEHRRLAAEPSQAYWAQRHAEAREYLLQQPAPEAGEVGEQWPIYNEIDRFLAAKLQEQGQEVMPLAEDLEFLRRLTIDTIGVVPTEEQIQQYLADSPETRRERAIERLLEHPGWADNWVGYWQDVLAENPNIINPTLNNTGPFRWWIHESFYDNKPFDRFVTELIMMEGSQRYGGPAGFALATQNDVPMASKAHILGQAFLGLEMQCARCHDAPAHDILQEDLFAAAAMLKRGAQVVPKTSTVGNPGEVDSLFIQVTLAPGANVPPKWAFEELVKEDQVPTQWLRNPNDTRERLALLVTAPQNTRFAQVIANRLWKRYMGRGLVEPVDDWEGLSPSHPELLDYLARELVLSGYDLKHLARTIFQSHAYQRRPISHTGSGFFYFAGPLQRKMTAEQLVDSLFSSCGKPFDAGPMNIDIDGAREEWISLDLGYPRRSWMFTSLSNERDRPSLSLPFAQPFVTVLETFGWRGARQNPTTVREDGPNVLQPAIIANGVLGRRFIRLSDDSGFTALALEDQPLEKLIERVYLRVYTREPTAEELSTFTELLREGYETRRTGEPAAPPRVLLRNQVGWSNQFDPRANQIKAQLQEVVEEGDVPTPQLTEDWRQRMEDMLWAMLCSPEFLFLP